MPVVAVHGDPRWCVPDVDEAPAFPNDASAPQKKLTYLIVQQMPRIISDCMSRVGHPTTESEVFVRPARLHGRSINAPNIWITVSPMLRPDIEDTATLNYMRRLIVDAINSFLRNRLVHTDVRNPRYDVDFDFMHGCGCSVDEDGQIVAEW